jgi:ribonuclease HI
VKAEVWFDGACSGNPGPTGYGAVVLIDGKRQVISKAGGHGTNNEAEYGGLIAGLEAAVAAGATDLILKGDSQLAIRQLEGRYAVKAANIKPLHAKATELLKHFSKTRLEWIPREANAEADAAARDGVA